MPCADLLIEYSKFRELFLESDRKLRERWDVQYLMKLEGDDEIDEAIEDGASRQITDDAAAATNADGVEYYTDFDIEIADKRIVHTFEDGTLAEVEVLTDDDAIKNDPDAIDDDGDDARYKCDLCAKSFVSMVALRTHNYIHNQGQYKCTMCPNKVLTTPGFLRLHMEKIHNVFVKKKTSTDESTVATKEKSEFCELCNRYFSKFGIISHRRAHQPNVVTRTGDGKSVFKCPSCVMTFSCRRNVRRHIRRVHNVDKPDQPAMFSCDVCTESFQFIEQWYEHYKTHDEDCVETPEGYNLNCEDCPVDFQTYEEYARHVVEKHQCDKVKPFKCRLCGVRKTTRVTLYMHINGHYEINAENKVKILPRRRSPTRKRAKPPRCLCPICGADYSTRQILKQHMLIHVDARPFPCEYCEKMFRNKSALNEHIRGRGSIYIYVVFSHHFNTNPFFFSLSSTHR